MDTGQGGYQGDIEAIASALADKSAGAEFIDEIRYGPQRSGAWHGEHETYGTEQQFMEGEKLQDLAGLPYQGEWRSTYANPITEFVAENPVTNLGVDARGILRQGGGATGLDWTMLGLSGLPMVAPYAKPVASTIGKVSGKVSDIVKAPFRKEKDILDIAKDIMSRPNFRTNVQIQYETDELNRLAKNLGIFGTDNPSSKSLEEIIRVAYTDSMSKLGVSSKQINKNLDDAFAQMRIDWDSPILKIPETLPESVARLPSAKPIQNMTWREWDNLHTSPFQLSDKQQGMMRAQGVSEDDVLDHFWGRGARDDFVGWLEEAIAKTGDDYSQELEFVRQRDLKSGYADKMTSKQFADDIAWGEVEVEAQKIAEIDPMVVAEKMSFKPSHVARKDWAQLTQELSREETINLARRMTLRLID